jgi:hypothetical protein
MGARRVESTLAQPIWNEWPDLEMLVAGSGQYPSMVCGRSRPANGSTLAGGRARAPPYKSNRRFQFIRDALCDSIKM